MKIVINRCYGGFELSKAVFDRLEIPYDGYGHLRNDHIGIESENDYAYRSDPRLIQAIEELGAEKASGRFAALKIVEIPDDVEWTIEEYDGVEWVAKKHRTWM